MGIELAVHRDDTVFGFVKDKVKEIITSASNNWYELDPGNSNNDLNNLFRFYRLPLLNWTKVQMEKYGKEKGWEKVMNETWFCHTPMGDKPCGICNPCRYTIEEGMQKRISRKGMLKYRFRFVFDCISFLKRGDEFLKNKNSERRFWSDSNKLKVFHI